MSVNREFTVIGDYLAGQIPYWYERDNHIDRNVNIGPDYALLFATDLNYRICDGQYRYTCSDGEKTLKFEIPDYLSDYTEIVKITKDGVALYSGTYSDNTVTLTDKVDMTAVYVLGYDGLYEKLSQNYKAVVDRETFNIYADESAYDEFRSDYGYSDDEPYKPENAARNKLLYIFFMPLVRILERIAAVLLRVIMKFNMI